MAHWIVGLRDSWVVVEYSAHSITVKSQRGTYFKIRSATHLNDRNCLDLGQYGASVQ